MASSTPPFNAKAIPSSEELSKAGQLEVLDVDGEKVKFGTVFENEKVIVVFIRAYMSFAYSWALDGHLCSRLQDTSSVA